MFVLFYLFYFICLFYLTFFNFNLDQLFLLNGLFNISFEDFERLFIVRIVLPHFVGVLFFFLVSLVIVSSFCMLSFKKLMNSLIHLILIFMIMSLLLLLLNFDFLAVLTLLIYVGAIMVFFLFAILLLLKFFSFKVMTVSKNKLTGRLDLFLLFYFVLALVLFMYSLVFSSRGMGEPFLYVSSFGFVDRSFIISLLGQNEPELTLMIFSNPIYYLKVYSLMGWYYLKDVVPPTNFKYTEFAIMDEIYDDGTLVNLAVNLSELDLIHVYGLQLYIYYGFLLIAAALLLSIVIFAALKISKPFKSIMSSTFSYK